MDSAIVLLIALAACVCLAAVVIGLVLLMNNNNNKTNKDDPPKIVFEGLPTTPPKVPQDLLQAAPLILRVIVTERWDALMKMFFESYSNCWEANYWLRVTLPSLMADVLKKALAAQTKPTSSKQGQEAQLSQAIMQAVTRAILSVQDLAKCPKQATVTLNTPAMQFTAGPSFKGRSVTYTVEQILKQVDDFKSGKISTLTLW